MTSLLGILRGISATTVFDASGAELQIVTPDGPVAAEFPREFSPIELETLLGHEVEYRCAQRTSAPDRAGAYAQTHEYTLRMTHAPYLRFQVVHVSTRNVREQ